jgi:hypothetical protein
VVYNRILGASPDWVRNFGDKFRGMVETFAGVFG